jgi:hypothetical protein
MTLDLDVGTHVPDAIVGLSTLDRVDYVDACTASAAHAAERSAEEWARIVLEQTALGRRAPLLWTVLGLRLGPRPSPDHIQGWRITGQGDNWVRAESGSWYASAQAVCRVDGAHVSVALFLRYDRPVAAAIWRVVGPLHRRGLPAMLRQAMPR